MTIWIKYVLAVLFNLIQFSNGVFCYSFYRHYEIKDALTVQSNISRSKYGFLWYSFSRHYQINEVFTGAV